MNPLSRCLLAAVAGVLAACGDPGHPAPEHSGGVPVDSAHEPGAASHDEPEALRPIMQRLGASMAGLQQALWLEDFDAMAVHAGAISGHVVISDEELARIRAELGEEMAAFEAADSTVHEAAVRLRAAVEARDLEVTLDELGQVQTGCVSCHAVFRDRLRTDTAAR
jgi:cytochrome c556